MNCQTTKHLQQNPFINNLLIFINNHKIDGLLESENPTRTYQCVTNFENYLINKENR